MTFATYELSEDQGAPVLLFDFFVGVAHWRYTTADRPITFSAVPFAPAAISAGSINQGNEIKKKTLAVTIPSNLPVALVLQTFPPSGDFMLTITAIHQTDPDLQGFVVFVGRVISQSQAGAVITMNCEPAMTGVKAVGLRRRYQLNCAHVLYGVGCTLTPSSFVVASAVSAVAGTTVTCAGLTPPAGLKFDGGYIEWDSGLGYLERRSINKAVGAVLTLAYGSPELAPGLAVNVYPGCDHSTAACTAFGNILNYGGQPYIPAVNPLVGNPIY
jgi:uncharacterized phage protein (TIGR02218 family)